MPLAYANMWTSFSSALGFYRLFICWQCPLSPLMSPLHKRIYHVVFYVLLLISYWHYIQRMHILSGQEFKALQLMVFQMCVCMINIVAYTGMWLRCMITQRYCFEYSMNAVFAYERIGHILHFKLQNIDRNMINKWEMNHYIIRVVMCRIACVLGILVRNDRLSMAARLLSVSIFASGSPVCSDWGRVIPFTSCRNKNLEPYVKLNSI